MSSDSDSALVCPDCSVALSSCSDYYATTTRGLLVCKNAPCKSAIQHAKWDWIVGLQVQKYKVHSDKTLCPVHYSDDRPNDLFCEKCFKERMETLQDKIFRLDSELALCRLEQFASSQCMKCKSQNIPVVMVRRILPDNVHFDNVYFVCETCYDPHTESDNPDQED